MVSPELAPLLGLGGDDLTCCGTSKEPASAAPGVWASKGGVDGRLVDELEESSVLLGEGVVMLIVCFVDPDDGVKMKIPKPAKMSNLGHLTSKSDIVCPPNDSNKIAQQDTLDSQFT